MTGLLEMLGECGTVVTCSAGNDATARPFFPAAFAPWTNHKGDVQAQHRDCAPVVSVGALNPNNRDGRAVQQHRAAGCAATSTAPPS